jgi:ParB family chromosome partitioning protein
MAKKFSFTADMLNDVSKVQDKIQDSENYKITPIPVENLIASDYNFYSVDDVENLANAIRDSGLQQPLVVRKAKTAEDKYEIISGHRRLKALKSIIESGDTKYKNVPCFIISSSIADDEVDTEIAVINGNATTRELSDAEKGKQITRLKELYTIKRERGDKFTGRIREKIAEDLNMSPTAVGRYEAIEKNLIPELKEQFEEGKIRMSTAAELATKPQDEQKAIYEKNPENLKLADVKEKKGKVKTAASTQEAPVKQIENDELSGTQPEQSSPTVMEKNPVVVNTNSFENTKIESSITEYIITFFKERNINVDKVTRFFKNDDLFAVEAVVNNQLETFQIIGGDVIRNEHDFSECVGLMDNSAQK